MIDWETLRSAFPIETKVCSKLLLTTRIEEVAKLGYHHELLCLNEEEGWQLLRRKALSSRNDDSTGSEVDTKMEDVGRDMVRRCGGLPLAIAVLGGVLKSKCTLMDWVAVNKDIGSYLRRGKGIEQGPGVVSQVLALSFNNLPFQLRPCFLYLGQFQEDQKIRVDRLCLKWVAEGMISTDDQREGESMIDVAERYLGELAQRSMVQVDLCDMTWWSLTKRFESCRLHDLVRDLCLSKAKEEVFFDLMHIKAYGSQVLTRCALPQHDSKARRLAIYLENDDNDKSVITQQMDPKSRQLRSLILRYSGEAWENSKWPVDLSNLGEVKLVRVLCFEGVKFPDGKLPKCVTNLIHLRYLRLHNCGLREMPSSICNWLHIEVLDLEHFNESSVTVPNVLWKMETLKFLGLPKKVHLNKNKKLRLDGLRKIETLKNFSTSVCNVNDLVKLPSLRYIELVVDGSLMGIAWFMDYLNNITSSHIIQNVLLVFKSCNVGSEQGVLLLGQVFRCPVHLSLNLTGCVATKLPEYDPHCFYLGLTYVGLFESELDEDPIPILEKLPNLQRVTLSHIVCIGKQMVCSGTGFPQLRTLKLRSLNSLEEWRVDEGAMPNLLTVVLDGCQNLKILPDGLKFLTRLRHLKILCVPDGFKNRARVVDGVEGEDFQKVRHVHSIDIE